MKHIYTLLTLLLLSLTINAQEIILTENAEVSILTIGPGTQLNDSFGHSAYRIKDENLGVDIVYNYGVFDFNTQNFYIKFARGKLLYKIVTNHYEPFYNSYVYQNRWVKEQILSLSYSEKQAMFDFLQNNAKPENRDYKYDFFYDNCATKIRDVLIKVLGNKLEYNDDYITESYSFRELIQQNLNSNTWGSLGIDIGLGAVIDKKVSQFEYQFLPEYIFKGTHNATIQRIKSKDNIVKETITLFENKEIKIRRNFFISPLFIFGLIGLMILFITYKDLKKVTRSRYLDAIIFFITGIIGVLLLLLWVATDHTSTAYNYNLLWAFPFSILFIFTVIKKHPSKWLRRYFIFLILLLVLLCLHWITGVQIFSIGLIPLFIALGVRYAYLVWFLKTPQRSH